MSSTGPNREEQLVIDCLESQGYTNIRFEPDGNVPPDLLLNNKIAIEVRRLNQNIQIEGGYEGLEQVEYSVHGLLKRIMDKFPSEQTNNGAFVVYHFNRPLPSKKELSKALFEILTNHKAHINERKKYSVSQNFKLEIWPSTKKLNSLYQYGTSSDDDSGGLIIGLIHDNLKLIIEEKERKIQGFKSNYPEWWLGLVDNIGYVIDDHDIQQFYDLPNPKFEFDRILMVSPSEPNCWRFLYE